MEPQIRFCTSIDGTRIAYAAMGSGPILLTTPSSWESISFIQEFGGPFYRPLAQRFRVVRYDRSGTGMSDRERQDFGMERDLADLEAVADAVGTTFALMGSFHLGPASIMYAARHPDRVSHLILYDTYARGSDLAREDVRNSLISVLRSHWGMASRMLADVTMPGVRGDIVERIARDERESTSSETVARLLEEAYKTDVTDLRPQISTPTLVIHRRGDRAVPARIGRELAAMLPNSRLVLLEGLAHWPWFEDSEAVVSAVTDFLSEERPGVDAGAAATSGAFRTVLFTDVEGSTALTQRLGDEVAREVLREHERIVRKQLRAHGGSEVKTMGDGFMASFGSATKALECAIAIQRAVDVGNAEQAAGNAVRVRIGLNAGEPITEGRDLFGTAVNMAARIAGKAQGGEIIASDVVRQLVAGKGFLFADRGEFMAKGFDEPMRVFEVRWRPDRREKE